MNKRTDIDFSNHILTVLEDKYTTIHEFKIHNKYVYSINFINVCGNLVVTGDFGNWVFCREFVPSAEGYVDGHYWIEKLKISSCQEPEKFSAEATEKVLIEYIKTAKYEEDEEMVEYYEHCLLYVDDGEWSYIHKAYEALPSSYCSESLVVAKEVDYSLLAVFDAFDEICNRLKILGKKDEAYKDYQEENQ